MPEAAAVNSGRKGLQLTLSHLGLGEGDELIVPGYTFAGLLPPIQALGIQPVPADIDPDTLGVTAAAVEARITPRTRGILALHTFGIPCDIEAVVDLGRRRSLPVIEDCAHSPGATVNGRQTGSFGTAAFFSFEAIKPVNTFGGGMVVSADRTLTELVRGDGKNAGYDLKSLSAKIRSVRLEQFLFDYHLAALPLYLLATPSLKRFASWLYHSVQRPVKQGSAYTPLQAELGLAGLEALPERVRRREEHCRLLSSLLPAEIRVLRPRDGCRASQYAFVVELPVPAVHVRKRLLWKGIDAGIGDELTDNCAAILGFRDCETLNQIFPRLMMLPLFDDMTEQQIRAVASAVSSAL